LYTDSRGSATFNRCYSTSGEQYLKSFRYYWKSKDGCNLRAAGDGPGLVEPLKDQTVVTPETAKFAAGVRGGEPRAEVRWFKAGKPLTLDGLKYNGVYEGELASLEVNECELADAGEYSLTATNKVGSVTSKATLTVHGTIHTIDEKTFFTVFFLFLPRF